MKHLFLLLTLLSFSLTALAQQKVTGKVKDSSGEPVIGASVVVKALRLSKCLRGGVEEDEKCSPKLNIIIKQNEKSKT